MLEPITSLQELQEYALRKLGDGAITINVTDEQIMDNTIDALQMFQKNHFDAVKKTHHILTVLDDPYDAGDKKLKTYTLPENILTVLYIIQNIDQIIDDPTLSFQWEFWEDKLRARDIDIAGFEFLQHKLQLLDYKLRNKTLYYFNFSTHTITFYSIPTDCNYIALCVYEINDPEEFPSILNNEWLKAYLIALLQVQWGNNLSKYTQVPLPGGSVLNSADILGRGIAEKERLEKELIDRYQEPAGFILA